MVKMTKESRRECKRRGHDLVESDNPKFLICKRCGALVMK